MAAELAGGVDALAAKAEDARLAGKLKWALELADDVLLLEPGNGPAFETKKATMLALAEASMNTQARNMLLSDYLIMTNQIQTPVGDTKLLFSMIDDNAVDLMPMSTLHRIMAVNLNAAKSLQTDMIVNLQLTDVNKNSRTEPSAYSLHARRGILEVESSASVNGDFVIVTDSRTWKDLVLGKLDPQTAISEKQVNISGGTAQQFFEFMHLFY